MSDAMQREVNRGLLKYACGVALFCGCGACLDWRRAVLLDFRGREIVACATCYDAVKAKLVGTPTAIDGRTL